MSESFVCLGHAMGILASLDRRAGPVSRIQQLSGQLLRHRPPRSLSRGIYEPTHTQRHAPIAANLNGDLIGRAANTTRLDLENRRGVPERELERLDRTASGLIFDQREGIIDDSFRGRLLSRIHHVVDELGERPVLKLGIGSRLPVLYAGSSWHAVPLTSSPRIVLAPWRHTSSGLVDGWRRRRHR